MRTGTFHETGTFHIIAVLYGSVSSCQVCFEERNVLGLNGVLGLDVRRTMASPFTSFR